ncbi:2-oxo acid dehydrogenase subunit E2 [Nocardioides caeni]|uniref:Dihydrolipoamide acetyltransferase component of pyruvate dehydrogenase complex n=2 Tax=Nocardioides caeni TaxID=574700 RepID=A0A4S8N0S5_9ACTN|nr:2-oxo acid dehydrogenase subunit E2 [Nocardioides caeni]
MPQAVASEFKLPDVGEGLTEAEIVVWRVKVGDTVAINDVVVEIETAKSIVELPSPYAGEVLALLVAEGETVEVGTPIIRIGDREVGEEAGRGGTEGAGSDQRPGPEIIDTNVPPVGQATLVGYGPKQRALKRRPRKETSVVEVPRAPASGLETTAPPAHVARALAKPLVRRLARDLGINLASVVPTGPRGTVSKEDVLAAAGSTSVAPAGPPAVEVRGAPATSLETTGVGATRETREPVKGVRKQMAAAMVASAFTAPHVTEWLTFDATATVELVERLRGRREFADIKVSPLLVAARACVLAMRRTPLINSSWDEAAQQVVVKDYVHLGFAAATPRGLVVPNVKDADGLSLVELAAALESLTALAREGRTPPADLAGGTFTITNVGVFGVDGGTPIINPGESAILCLGAIKPQPWVVGDQVVPRQVMTLSLSFDHRHIDGATGSRFLADVAGILQDPGTALLF